MTSGQSIAEPVKRKWWALTAVCFGLFMALLDVTVVNVALPSIQVDLQSNFTNLEWVLNAYTLVFAVALVTVSRLGDIFGRKTVFIWGLAVFTMGSLLCAVSSEWTIGGLSHIAMLNLSRGIQGLGASAMMPLSLSIISSTFAGKQRGMAMGIWGGVSGLATAIGPLVGGLLVNAINWQSIFYLNIPIGIVGIFVSLWAITPSKDDHSGKKVDLFGFVTFTIFVFCLIYGLIEVNNADMGWASPAILTLWSISLVALIIFLIGELKVANPMVDPRLFKIPSFTGSAIAGFCLSAGMYALLFYLSLYFQNFLGFDALATGLRFITFTMLALLFGPVAGIVMGKFGSKWLLVVSMALLAVGVWFMSGMSPSDAPADWIALLPGFIIAGIGNGLVNPPISNLAIGTVELRRSGMASGVNSVFRQMGSAFGIAFFGAVLSNRYTAFLHDRMQALQGGQLSAEVLDKISTTLQKAGPIPGSLGFSGSDQAKAIQQLPDFHEIQQIARASFVDATSVIVQVAAVILAIGAICCVCLIRKKDLKH